MTTADAPASKEAVTAALLVIGGKILSGRTKGPKHRLYRGISVLRDIDVDCRAGENGGGDKCELLADDERRWHTAGARLCLSAPQSVARWHPASAGHRETTALRDF